MGDFDNFELDRSNEKMEGKERGFCRTLDKGRFAYMFFRDRWRSFDVAVNIDRCVMLWAGLIRGLGLPNIGP